MIRASRSRDPQAGRAPARRRRLALAAWVCVSLGSSALANGDDPDEAELEHLRAEILALIGDARCANLVHCRALPLGTRPCGGPAEYLPYSSIAGHREELETRAYEYTFLQEDMLRRHPTTGACVALPEPRLQCVDNHCKLDTAH